MQFGIVGGLALAMLALALLLLPGCAGEAAQQKAPEKVKATAYRFIFIGNSANDTMVVETSGMNFSSAVGEAIGAYENSTSGKGNRSDALPPAPPED